MVFDKRTFELQDIWSLFLCDKKLSKSDSRNKFWNTVHNCEVEPCKRVNDKGVVTFFGSAAWRKRNCGPFRTNDSYFYTHTQIVLTHTFFHKSYWLRTSQTKSCLHISCKQWRTDRRVCYFPWETSTYYCIASPISLRVRREKY